MQQLIKDVESGSADFAIILVYDVSRWGRFQDADESAYYEYRCRRAGIQVAYCAEQFENDGSPVSTIVKGVKRAMAGEYSRELSAKVFAGQCRLIELGYRQGGPAGYGLRRILIDQNGTIKAELARGEQKSLQTDRVILMPGPEEEVRTVNLMYHWFINEGLIESEIAGRLNGMRVQTDLERDWTRGTVHEVLTNEKYIGNNIYNRRSFKLKKLRVENTPDMWIKKEGAFKSIVPPDVYYTAQGILRARAHRYTDEELIERLRNLYQNRGFLSGLIIDETEGMPSTSIYLHRFGSLIRAYQMVGLTEQSPQAIYLTDERKTTYKSEREALSQSAIDQAFSRPPKISANYAEHADKKIYLLNGADTGHLGVVSQQANDEEGQEIQVRLTNLERTLIDITVRPVYAGGVFEVAKAFELAKERVSVNKLVAMLNKLDFAYPYHQAIGYYLERAAYKASQLDLIRRLPIQHDFYLAHDMGKTRYENSWRLHIPNGF